MTYRLYANMSLPKNNNNPAIACIKKKLQNIKVVNL